MNRKRMSAVLGVVMAGLFSGVVVSPAVASGGPSLKALTARGMSKSLTAADRAYLRAHPDVAALVPDESLTVWGEEPMPDRVQTAAEATYTCSGTDRYQIHKSALGSVIFRYHSYVGWCWNSAGTTVRSHYPYIDMAQSVVDNEGITVSQLRSLSTYSKQTQHQNKIRLCVVRYGCYATLYPTNWVAVKNAYGSTFAYRI